MVLTHLRLEEAKTIKIGTVLYDCINVNADGMPARWRVTGKPKTWKTRPNEVRVPVKRGLHDSGYVTQNNLANVFLSEDDAIEARQWATGVKKIRRKRLPEGIQL